MKRTIPVAALTLLGSTVAAHGWRPFSRQRSLPEPELQDVQIALSDQWYARRAEKLVDALGPALDKAVAGRLTSPARTGQAPGSWSLHSCLFDRECRQAGAPARIHIGCPFGHLTLAPGSSAFADRSGLQAHLSWQWDERHACRNIVRLYYRNGLLFSYRLCPLRVGHRRPCVEPGTRTPFTRPVVEHRPS